MLSNTMVIQNVTGGGMMSKKTIMAIGVLMTGLMAVNTIADGSRDLWEIMNMIRSDKFDYVLPKAMRNNDIDMWITIDKGRGTEPLYLDFGDESSNGSGMFVFTDRGDRIERAVLFGHGELLAQSGVYDIIGYRGTLKEFVKERDPKRIGVNFTTDKELFPPEGRHLSDGLSHTDYINLKKELGEPYASRLVSAERLIADYRAERVPGEIILFSKVANVTRKLQERALSNEVIIPGKTTMLDVCWWMDEQRHALDYQSGWFPSVFLSPPDGVEIANTNRVIQPGDILQIDWGIGKHNFHTDMKRFSYVMGEGETRIPAGIQRAFDESRKIRELIRKNVKSGKTGRELLDNLKRLVRKAGYVYTEKEHPSDVEGIEVNIGMHPCGNLGHGVGASLFEIFPVRTTYEVMPNSLFAFEFIVFTPAPEWGGNKVPVCVEENALVTEHGIQWVHPPQNEILIIR